MWRYFAPGPTPAGALRALGNAGYSEEWLAFLFLHDLLRGWHDLLRNELGDVAGLGKQAAPAWKPEHGQRQSPAGTRRPETLGSFEAKRLLDILGAHQGSKSLNQKVGVCMVHG